MHTGYFSRASEDGHSQAISGVHIVDNGKAICGYKPAAHMQFVWCSHSLHLPYVSCKKCKQKIAKQEKK